MSAVANEFNDEASEKAVDPNDGMISRALAAQLLGVSKSTVRRLGDTGVLHPKVDGEGVHWLDVAEVTRMVMQRRKSAQTSPTDELAARAFELFGESVPLRDVVLQLRLAPDRVASLHDQWRRLGSRRELWSKPQEIEDLAELLGDFGTVAELIQRARLVSQRLVYLEEKLDGLLHPSAPDAPNTSIR